MLTYSKCEQLLSSTLFPLIGTADNVGSTHHRWAGSVRFLSRTWAQTVVWQRIMVRSGVALSTKHSRAPTYRQHRIRYLKRGITKSTGVNDRYYPASNTSLFY